MRIDQPNGDPSVNKVLIAPVGLPASGKSTWARERVQAASNAGPVGSVTRVSGDDLREMMHGGIHPGEVTERQVWKVVRLIVGACFETGAQRVIIDAMNLNPAYLQDWYSLADECGARFEVRSFLDVPLATCLQRNARRADWKRIPEERIKSLHEAWSEIAQECVRRVQSGFPPMSRLSEKSVDAPS